MAETCAAAAPAFLHAVTSPISLPVCLTHLLLHLQATHCEGFVKLVDRFVMLERQDAFQVGVRHCWVLGAGCWVLGAGCWAPVSCWCSFRQPPCRS